MLKIKDLVLGLFLIGCQVKINAAFSECPQSGLADPTTPGVSDCPSWLGYLQSIGANIEDWCKTTGSIKCCLTCKNILDSCTDRAYVPDCQLKFSQGLCQNQLADQNTVQVYCRKTCGFCSLSAVLSCNFLSQACGQGTCVPVNYFSTNSIKCSCPSNLAGSYCQRSNPCLSFPCRNGGSCIASNDEDLPYTCICPLGFSGPNCQNFQATGCASSPCQNNGLCNSLANGEYSCICLPNFFGIRCEFLDRCASNPCRNGGTCTNSGNGYTCSCPLNFSGLNCQLSNACSNSPCLNGGFCSVGSLGQIVCTCQSGFSGEFCQNSLTCGTGGFCQNGGSCILQGGNYICLCPANVYGRNCEYVVSTQTCLAGDKNPNYCSIWSTFNFCRWIFSYNSVPVPIYCPISCGLCPNGGFCTDSQVNCAFWSDLGLCGIINNRDPNLCKRSCGLCGNLIKKK